MADKLRYTVTSDRLVGHDRGDTVTADDLGGDARAARLIQAGSITPKRATATKKGDA